MQPARYIGLGLGLLSITLSASVNAELDERFYIAPMASYSFFDDDSTTLTTGTTFNVNPDDEVGYALAIGKPLGELVNIEAYAFRTDDVQSSGGKYDIEGYGLSALLFPFRNSTTTRDFIPVYGILGIAAGDYSGGTFSGSRNGDTDFIDIGVGYLQQFFNYGLGIRAEYRYRSADVEVDNGRDLGFGDHIVQLGLHIPLGTPPEQPKPEEPARAAPPPPPPPAPRDSDGDGVLDPNDECPGTPPNTEVDEKGCPLENEAPIVLKGVTFEFNSDNLTSSATSRLDNVVNALKGSPDIEVLIKGHTDSVGNDEYNLELSNDRAASVRKYLADHGIEGSRMDSKGFGENQPVAPNAMPDGSDNPEGRAKNRRVELEVTSQ